MKGRGMKRGWRRFLMRRAGWLVSLTVLAAIAIYRQYPAVVTKPGVLALDLPQVPPIGLKPVPARYEKKTVREILTDFGRQLGEPVEIDFQELAGWVPLDQVVSIDAGLEKLAAREVVRLINASVVQGDGPIAVDFARLPVLISTHERLVREQVTRVYPVGDLLQVRTPWVEWEWPEKRVEALANFVETAVDSGQWIAHGGLGHVRGLGDALEVTAPAGTQFRVAAFLELLRRE